MPSIQRGGRPRILESATLLEPTGHGDKRRSTASATVSRARKLVEMSLVRIMRPLFQWSQCILR